MELTNIVSGITEYRKNLYLYGEQMNEVRRINSLIKQNKNNKGMIDDLKTCLKNLKQTMKETEKTIYECVDFVDSNYNAIKCKQLKTLVYNIFMNKYIHEPIETK